MISARRINKCFQWATALACAGMLAACQSKPDPVLVPVVSAPVGVISGLAMADKAEGGVFLGVPFAAAPTGNLRWKPPQPLTASSEGAPYEATSYAPACIQGDYIVSWYAGLIDSFGGDPEGAARPVSESEDCLHLNVWTPDLTPENPLPVMVWIHGGSFMGGWSYEPNYEGARLSEEGVIVVSLAYRLGALGFIGPDAHDTDAPVNFGLMDQIAGLKWVKENIRAFGGDPENITVFGESAGASSVGTLMTMPDAEGLFQRAISQSGGFEFLPAQQRSDVSSAFLSLSASLAAQGLTPITASAEQILEASNTVLADYDFGPVVDGDVIAAQPSDLLDEGKITAVDLMIGTNQDEWLMYLDPATPEEDMAGWKARYPEAVLQLDALVERYGLPGALDRVETAIQMRCPGQRLADAVAARGSPVYIYEFNRVRAGAEEAGLGSYHGAELPYVFGTHDAWIPTNEADIEISDFMREAWAQFAKTGSPEKSTQHDWPEYGATGLALRIDEERSTGRPVSEELCAVLGPDQMTEAEQ